MKKKTKAIIVLTLVTVMITMQLSVVFADEPQVGIHISDGEKEHNADALAMHGYHKPIQLTNPVTVVVNAVSGAISNFAQGATDLLIPSADVGFGDFIVGGAGGILKNEVSPANNFSAP